MFRIFPFYDEDDADRKNKCDQKAGNNNPCPDTPDDNKEEGILHNGMAGGEKKSHEPHICFGEGFFLRYFDDNPGGYLGAY